VGNEGLLDSLVHVGLGLVGRLEGLGDVGKLGGGGVAEVVVVEETSVTLLDELAVGRVEADVVELVDALSSVDTVAVGDTVGSGLLGRTGLGGLGLLNVGRVGVVEGAEVSGNGPGAVNSGLVMSVGGAEQQIVNAVTHVFSREVGLVEVPGVGNIGTVNGYTSATERCERGGSVGWARLRFGEIQIGYCRRSMKQHS
jgi:hypothetical protein